MQYSRWILNNKLQMHQKGRQFHLRFWHRQRLCFGICDADILPGIRIPCSPHWHPLLFTLSKYKPLKNLTNLTVLFPCVATVLFITCRFLYICVNWGAVPLWQIYVFNQILFKWVSFQSELSAWETSEKQNFCSCGSISEKLQHRQKGFRSTGHNQDKKHVTDPLCKDWCWDTSFVAHWQHQTAHYIMCLNCLSLNSWSLSQLR